jgi:UDP-glucose 4-epimerase
LKNETVCVIGGAGFLGSHLVDYLIEEGNEVIVLDNLISGRKDFVNPKAKFVWCDITHSEHLLIKIFKEYKINYVFNYAAVPYVPVSFARPLHVFDINARGALMVMNAAQEAGVKRILQVSSAEIYGDVRIHEDFGISEYDKAVPHSTYGAAKLAIDALVQTRWRESKCPVIALRQFNCLGERDTLHPYILPEIYRQAIVSDCVLLGNNSTRDFIYAGDAVKMAVELLEKGECGEVYNLGSQETIKMYDLASLVGIFLGKTITVMEDEARKRPWEIWSLRSNNSKIYSVIDARPTVRLDEAVKRTIDYYKHNADKWSF